jgi:ABC-type uncharacterized transport system fused permease/ATPase subunit
LPRPQRSRGYLWSAVLLPYWQQRDRAVGWLVLLLLLSALGSGLIIWETFPKGEVISALARRDGGQFWQQLLWALGILLLMVPVQASRNWVQGRLSLEWRQWLTDWFLQHYLRDRFYYHAAQTPSLDHPDQRIAEDVRTVTQQVVAISLLLADSTVQFLGFAGVLWGLSPWLLLGLVLYASASTGLVAGVIGPVLARLNAEQLKREATFRFGLMRLRDHAEAIALDRGEVSQRQQCEQQFRPVLANVRRLMRWQFLLSGTQNFYLYLGFFLPFLILAPQILAGQLELGAVQQSQAAFERVTYVLGLLIYQLDQLSGLRASVGRLAQLLQPIAPQPTQQIQRQLGDRVELRQVTLHLPPAAQPLLAQVNLAVEPGGSLLIMGPSGVGKTSLLRAIAGLWSAGSGTIICPERQHLLFLPQRPYLTLGSLRQQLHYPQGANRERDDELLDILHQVDLQQCLEQWGGLEAVADWSTILSRGEQQRLAFARLLLQRPAFACLDEATSALDETQEARLYACLKLMPMTYISIGHRPTLKLYHDQVLVL